MKPINGRGVWVLYRDWDGFCWKATQRALAFLVLDFWDVHWADDCHFDAARVHDA